MVRGEVGSLTGPSTASPEAVAAVALLLVDADVLATLASLQGNAEQSSY